jgi:predicted RNA-binding Zn-ribbon protein involved in translation (DUF1610 family)
MTSREQANGYLWRCTKCKLVFDPDEETAIYGQCPRCGNQTLALANGEAER